MQSRPLHHGSNCFHHEDAIHPPACLPCLFGDRRTEFHPTRSTQLLQPEIDRFVDWFCARVHDCRSHAKAFTPLGNPINEQGRSIGDLDDDCLVTLGDYLFFAICLDISGPGHVPAFNDCIEAFDFDGDRDVDLRDFSVFERSIVPDQDG